MKILFLVFAVFAMCGCSYSTAADLNKTPPVATPNPNTIDVTITVTNSLIMKAENEELI